MDDANPYASPVAEESPEETAPSNSGGDRFGQARRWCFAYALNMPLPVMFGVQGTNAWGKAGMAVGVAIIMAGGVAITYRSQLVGQALTRGGFLFALTQLFPAPQVMSGFAAVMALHFFGFEDPFDTGNDMATFGFVGLMGGFVATVVSGTLLAMGCLATGFLLRVVTPNRGWADS